MDKKKKQAGTDSYREKIRRHKRRRYRRNAFLVALATLALMVAVIFWMHRGYAHADLHRLVTLGAEDDAAYENLGGNIVRYSSRGASCYDRGGKALWEISYQMQQPLASVDGNVIAIGGRGGYDIYVMDQHGLRGSIRTTLPVQSLVASERGRVAVIMDDTRSTWIRLYTDQGEEIAYIVRAVAESGYPIAMDISPDGETLCVSSLQLSGASVKTNISFFNFGKSGQGADDHLVGQSDYIDQVAPVLHYLDNATCACVSDKGLYIFHSTFFPPFHKSGPSNAQLSESLSDVQGVFFGDGFLGILTTDEKGQEQYCLDIYNKRGKTVGTVHFSCVWQDIAIAGDKVYIHDGRSCFIYTLSGRRVFEGNLGRNIQALAPGAGLGDFLVVAGDEIDSVRLQ